MEGAGREAQGELATMQAAPAAGGDGPAARMQVDLRLKAKIVNSESRGASKRPASSLTSRSACLDTGEVKGARVQGPAASCHSQSDAC